MIAFRLACVIFCELDFISLFKFNSTLRTIIRDRTRAMKRQKPPMMGVGMILFSIQDISSYSCSRIFFSVTVGPRIMFVGMSWSATSDVLNVGLGRKAYPARVTVDRYSIS
jgi:hypothetical protein